MQHEKLGQITKTDGITSLTRNAALLILGGKLNLDYKHSYMY
jgi:hypothetical protein